MFRATKGSGVTITTILRNNAIETRPGNKIHHLGEKRSACVHCAPDWKTRIGEDVTSRILDRVQGATKKNTSETLVLQRYAEIVPSVNRTAVISDGKMGDALALDLITPEAGAIYVMDRGYVDFQRLYVIHQAGAFFVTRTKVNMKYHRVYSHPVPGPATGVGSDQSIALDGFYTKQDYPQHLRRVSFRDPETGLHLVFLTNNFTLSATMIAALYKKRWAVELFFKWIKQNLRIKHFYGTSENAVKTQIWIAVCVYVLAAIIKIDLALDVSLYTFLQVLSVHSFEKTPLAQALFDGTSSSSPSTPSNQLNLFTN